MKKLFAVLAVALLAGCNSSSDSTDDKTLPPATHLPEIEVPERPQPQLPPEHLPGDDTSPDRPTPDNWYQEVSDRFGMTVAALHKACSFEGEHLQYEVFTGCSWQNETLTVTYYVAKNTGDSDPGDSSSNFEHNFTWVVNDANIDAGKIWPQANHLATGLDGKEMHIEYGKIWYSLSFCDNGLCTEDGEYNYIEHPLSHISDNNHVFSDGTPLDGGESDFVIDSYRTAERLFFIVHFTDNHTNYVYKRPLMMDTAYPAIIYDVLAPAFGY
ncbi:hypothetical protein C9J03_00765 [Photobacterium gaetbulicola]|uniref:Lipoprotein n=1 Tax=Photobacterium gaetbulicola Gung47 TaxID=658445 RepID=A0A0C5WHL8_9GAMM|nr:hypothetical protein [Photobacterium gaetbulicola]AJR05672.1 hypothetical protein H744_1c0647 [Photobacterium gaetbulicola Gung47]PSU14650.1 hypothetical protein C9J03_00765 [Photobacterium gaetbulicola]